MKLLIKLRFGPKLHGLNKSCKMFKKPCRVKTSNRMKGSERKRLKQTLLKQFHALSDEMLSSVLPNKEDMFVTKLENANNVYITCYCVNKNPMFYEIDKETILYPTDLIPSMVTSSIVFEKICRGADLMLPGVITQYGGFDNVMKGQIVAVRVAGNRAPIAVGVSTMTFQDMVECGMKGKGIIISHWYTDNLWALGDSLEIPHICDEFGLESTTEDIEDAVQNLEVANDVANFADESSIPKEDGKEDSLNEEIDCKKKANAICDPNNIEEIESIEKDNQLTLEEAMGQLLENCFYQAILDAKKVELPMLVTKFSAQYLHPACPEGQKIDVKKSKYKKMSKFLQEMESRGLVKVAELSKGVLSITELTVEHECLRMFKASPFARDRKVAKEEAKSKEAAELAKENQGILVLEMFAVSGKTQTFFKLFQKSKGDAMTAIEIRELLTGYVRDNELNSKADKRRVVLDPILSDVLFDKEFNQESVTWDILFTRFLNKMNPCHKTVIGGKESKLKKGKIEPIEVKLQQRTGNKKVTLVQNLEQYGIDPNEFAHQIQLSAASSTAVNSNVDKSSSSQQVLIQGNQTAHVAKLLDDLKVPRKYIIGLDKVKSFGKKR